MSKCPYCVGEIPEAAMKCMHCGEWVKRPPEQEPSPAGRGSYFQRFWRGERIDDTLNDGIKWYVQYRIAVGVISLIVMLVMLFGFILPTMNEVQRGRDRFPVPEMIRS